MRANLKSHDKAMNALKRFCGWIAEWGVRYPHIVVALGLLVVVGFGAIYVTLPPRYRLADQVPDREQAVAASEQLDAKLTGANPLHVMIDYPKGKTLYDPDVLKVIGDVHSIVETQSGVGNVWSIETLRRWLAKTQEDTPDKLKEYVSILPDYLTKRFIDEPDNSVVVTGRIPDIDVSDLLPVIEKLDGKLNVVRDAHPDYRIVVTGLSAIAARNSATMIGKLNAGLTTEIVFICIFLGLAFRSVMVAIVTVLPTLFPVFTAGAVLAASGEGLQFASIVALIVSFGLSLNAAVHYLNRLAARGPARRGPGHRRRARDRSDRPRARAHLADPRFRPWRDRAVRPALAPPVRQALGDDAGGGADRRSRAVARERAALSPLRAAP